MEEVREFLESETVGEAIDVIQVLRDWAQVERGTSPEELESLRVAKVEDRGDFLDCIVWCGNEPRRSGLTGPTSESPSAD